MVRLIQAIAFDLPRHIPDSFIFILRSFRIHQIDSKASGPPCLNAWTAASDIYGFIRWQDFWGIRKHKYSVCSWLLLAALGCSTAALDKDWKKLRAPRTKNSSSWLASHGQTHSFHQHSSHTDQAAKIVHIEEALAN